MAPLVTLTHEKLEDLRPFSLTEGGQAQAQTSPEEQDQWHKAGAKVNEISLGEDGKQMYIWNGPKGQLVIPKRFLNEMCLEAAHLGLEAMKRLCQNFWHPDMERQLADIAQDCEICTQFNPRPTVKEIMGMFPLAKGPGEEIVTDFTDMGEWARGKRYLLVVVDA